MPKRSSKARDFAAIAKNVVEKAIGEKLAGSSLENPDEGKNPNAVALGRLGGEKGGRARAKSLSKERRREIVKKAAIARWKHRRSLRTHLMPNWNDVLTEIIQARNLHEANRKRQLI